MLVLLGMVMLLLGINHLFTHHDGFYDDSASDRLRKDMNTGSSVIPPESLFSGFLARSIRKAERKPSGFKKKKKVEVGSYA